MVIIIAADDLAPCVARSSAATLLIQFLWNILLSTKEVNLMVHNPEGWFELKIWFIWPLMVYHPEGWLELRIWFLWPLWVVLCHDIALWYHSSMINHHHIVTSILCIPWSLQRFPPRHRFQRKPLVSDPGMHHARAVMHVGTANPWWRGKRSRHSQHMRNQQICVSGKRPMGLLGLLSWYPVM